ncbi:ArnT family glycosyltransferase [Catenovulum agarivorans]|uniref:ArnT family glycosyltransferase n=1 Tax=Catenovulum agarivorans TaxID=1172192 RepID=UPI000309241B|nr:glycosyltransferase family 39 protein [Catenovulum agarivorans]
MQINAYSNKLSAWQWLLLIVSCVFAYRISVTINTPITLFYDEAYYLSWAQNLDWGYYSKPPMVAWLIATTTAIFGMAEWAVKLSAPVLYAATALLCFAINKHLFNDKAGFWAGLMFMIMPLVSLNSLFVTTDAPQLFFWAAAFYAFLRAQSSNAWQYWLLAGVLGGCGLLSKYTFILLPVTFLLYAIISQSGRAILTNSRFWLACALAISILLPNLIWNYHHDFISFQHTSEISKHAENTLSFARMFEFLALQLIVFGPIALIILIACGLSKKTSPEPKQNQQTKDSVKLLWCLFLPTLLVISLQALTARANMNWAAAAFVGASLLAGYYFAQMWQSNKRTKLVIASAVAINLFLMLAFYHFNGFTQLIGVERTQHNDPYKRILKWPELVRQFDADFQQNPQMKLASDSRKLLAYFGYYLTNQDFQGAHLDGSEHIGDHYELKYAIAKQPANEYFFVTQDWTEQELQTHFQSVKLIKQQKVKVYKNFDREVRLYQVGGFKQENNK